MLGMGKCQMKQTKEQRRAYVSKRAYELAQSGKCLDSLAVESALSAEGYPEARSLLDRDSIRKDLDKLCQQARPVAPL
jgi:hypothetical protein